MLVCSKCRVAVITIGNSGIGLERAKLFAASEAKVVITRRRQQAIDDALWEIGPDAVGLQGDGGKLANHRAAACVLA